MTAVNQSPTNAASSVNAAVTEEFRRRNDRKTTKVSREIDADQESNGSSSEDMEIYSPKSVVARIRKWPVPVKNVNVCGGCVHSQILRIRAEDSHLGEDIGECLISKEVAADSHQLDVKIISRPASPLSGKAASIKTVD